MVVGLFSDLYAPEQNSPVRSCTYAHKDTYTYIYTRAHTRTHTHAHTQKEPHTLYHFQGHLPAGVRDSPSVCYPAGINNPAVVRNSAGVLNHGRPKSIADPTLFDI